MGSIWAYILASLPGWGGAIAASFWNSLKTRRHVTEVTATQTDALGEIARAHVAAAVAAALAAYNEGDGGNPPAHGVGGPRPDLPGVREP